MRVLEGEGESRIYACRYEDFRLDWLESSFGISDFRATKVQISSVASSENLSYVLSVLNAAEVKSPLCAKVKQGVNGLHVAYSDLSRLGVDRWLVMLAGTEIVDEAFCVMDFGTAITADFVTATRDHIGGYIVPGRDLMRGKLLTDTASVGVAANFSSLETRPGVSTDECVIHGINKLVQGFICAVEFECSQLGISKLLVTGGDARSFVFGMNMLYKKDLVFDGLVIAMQ